MAVIDASAALYVAASADGFASITTVELAAPALLWSEITSVLNEMRWRGDISEALADATFARLCAAPIARRASVAMYRQARAVARELGWAKTYDAEYVALAQSMGTRLVTRDDRLRRRAGRLIEVVGPDEVATG